MSNENWWRRMRRKYRLAILDDLTLREVFHMRLSGMGTITFMTLLFLLMMVLFSLLIVLTPIRNILPGYSESIRQQLIEQTARVDSLQTSLTVQRQYLDVIKQLTAGDIRTDSVQPLDSVEMIERTRLLEQSSPATEAFLSQYEQRERDRLFHDSRTTPVMLHMLRPAKGVITQSANIDRRQYATFIRTTKHENVLAVMRGTIISVERTLDNSYTVVLQQNQYIAVYRRLATLLKQQGTQVEAGETIGLMDGENELAIELWDAGRFVNPEEVIVW